MADLDSFTAISSLTIFFDENNTGTVQMAYMIERFIIEVNSGETNRMALALAKNMFNGEGINHE